MAVAVVAVVIAIIVIIIVVIIIVIVIVIIVMTVVVDFVAIFVSVMTRPLPTPLVGRGPALATAAGVHAAAGRAAGAVLRKGAAGPGAASGGVLATCHKTLVASQGVGVGGHRPEVGGGCGSAGSSSLSRRMQAWLVLAPRRDGAEARHRNAAGRVGRGRSGAVRAGHRPAEAPDLLWLPQRGRP